MASPPTTLTAVPGDKIAATAYNAGARDPIDFLLDPPRCRVADGTGIAIADGATVLMTWSNEVYDTDTMHDTVSNTSRVVFTTEGYYQTSFAIQLPTATYTVSNIDVRLNAGGVIGGGSNLFQGNFQTARRLTGTFTRAYSAGDYIELFVTQTSGASRTTVTGDLRTFVETRWVGVP